MSLSGKYLVVNNNTINRSSSSSSLSSDKSSLTSTFSLKLKENPTAKQSQNRLSFNQTMPNCLNNKSKNEKFEFKPIILNTATSTPFNFNQNKTKLTNSSIREEKLINNLLHSTSKNGKIIKRKQEKNIKKATNLQYLQCFNLTEKEKFRQLISENLVSVNKNNQGSNNLYQNLIRYSPIKIEDDNFVESKKNKGEYLIEKYNVSNIFLMNNNQFGKTISTGYSRRISPLVQNNQQDLISKNSINKNPNKIKANEKNSTIIELDLTENDSVAILTSNNKKSAQKRHTNHQNNLNEQQCVDLNNYDLSAYQTISKVNRKLTEFEHKLNDKLNKNSSILETILRKSQTKSNALMIEEERYKLKKIQRLEKDKIEKELAARFSQQLHLETNKLSCLLLEEEKVEIEDEFLELNEEQENQISNALIPSPQEDILVNGFGATITRKDIQTLKGLNWLNDEIINFYMNLICERSQNNNNLLKIYAFSTFFYPKLLKDGYNSLRRWTRKVDLFTYDLILIPVHLGLHWTLSVIDFTCKEIRYYDSMNGNNTECLKALRNYLNDEYADKKNGCKYDLTDWNCIHVKDVPQQMNGSDCGMFTCKYAEFLSRGKSTFGFNQVK